MIQFKAIDPQEIKERFPKFYREDAQYSSILKNGEMKANGVYAKTGFYVAVFSA